MIKKGIDKLKTTPVYLSRPSNIVKNNVVKTTVYDKLVKMFKAIQTINTSDLVKKAKYNTKIEHNKKIPSHDKS